MTSARPHDAVDYFISYNHADAEWAEWIAQTLEANGHRTIFQAWDFLPGNKFVMKMHDALQRSKRVLVVLSPSSLESDFVASEWASFFAEDPSGEKRRLIGVRVIDCEPPGLLKTLIYIDLVELSADTATTELLNGLSEGRRKPSTEVPFPGATTSQMPTRMNPASDSLTLKRANNLPDVSWRDDHNTYSAAHLEIYLIPPQSETIQARRLEGLASDLVAVGRNSGVFAQAAGVQTRATADTAVAYLQPDRSGDQVGLAINRNGQLSTWGPLPHDQMGSMFDRNEMREHTQHMIDVLLKINITYASEYTFAAAITSPSLLTFGSVDVLGNRTSASMSLQSGDIRVNPEDTATVEDLREYSRDVAEEIVARLEFARRESR